MDNQQSCKIVFIGPEGVGKTTLFKTYHTGIFSESQPPTIGGSFCFYDNIIDGKTISLNVWDTAGQERFDSMIPLYIRDATIILLCIDSPDETLIHRYIDKCQQTNQRAKIYIVFTKCDLIQDLKPYDALKKILKAEGFSDVWYTSALKGRNISPLFDDISRYASTLPSIYENDEIKIKMNHGKKSCLYCF